MTLQDIIKSLDDLSVTDQTSLLYVLQGKLSQTLGENVKQPANHDGESFWQGIVRFRQTIEQEGLIFTEDDFANLRDRSLGREIAL